jgi:cytochrome c2
MKQLVVATAAVLLSVSAAYAAGDAALGEKVFNKCKACHAVGEGATNKVGPVLNGIIGRKAASIDSYTGYGDGLKKLGADGLVWEEAKLTEYLRDPKAFNPTTKMSFVGLKKDEDIADVLAYLGQFGADGKKK